MPFYIVKENLGQPHEAADVEISASTCGGCSYSTRILKALKKNGTNSVIVSVESGACQNNVIDAIKKQLQLIEDLAQPNYSVKIIKRTCLV